jgi:hypothetical protein
MIEARFTLQRTFDEEFQDPARADASDHARLLAAANR